MEISETTHVHNIYLLTFNDGRETYLEEVKERLHEYRHFPPHPSDDKDKDRGMGIDR